MNINPETIQIGNYRPDKWVSVEMLAPIKTKINVRIFPELKKRLVLWLVCSKMI
jgi:hypothetical protein